MQTVIDCAAYIYNRYKEVYGAEIDEMKLHKLLYFVQRESIIQTGAPMFSATFWGWKYGPVIKEIRGLYKEGVFNQMQVYINDPNDQHILDFAFDLYSSKDTWSLSRLTHGEISWINSRIGISEDAAGSNPISIDDIYRDANRVKERRALLAHENH